MSLSWENAKKRLVELQKELIPEPLKVRYMNEKGEEEILTVEELLEIPNNDCTLVRVVSGSNIKDLEKVLEWEIQSLKCVIE